MHPDWIAIPKIGAKVASSHPITLLNPDPTFFVEDIKYERGSFWIRGEKTCWFHIKMISEA